MVRTKECRDQLTSVCALGLSRERRYHVCFDYARNIMIHLSEVRVDRVGSMRWSVVKLTHDERKSRWQDASSESGKWSESFPSPLCRPETSVLTSTPQKHSVLPWKDDRIIDSVKKSTRRQCRLSHSRPMAFGHLHHTLSKVSVCLRASAAKTGLNNDNDIHNTNCLRRRTKWMVM